MTQGFDCVTFKDESMTLELEMHYIYIFYGKLSSQGGISL